jgi:hypothetical protein
MSLFTVALKRAVRTGKVVAKCGHCRCTLMPEEYKFKLCLVCGDLDMVAVTYMVPENLVTS